MSFPINPNPGDSYQDSYNTTWVYAGPVNGWYRQTVSAGNQVNYSADFGGDFIQTGIGAVQRTVQSKLQDVASVKDFGAVGDGVADDTAAIQTALSSGILSLYFPSGTYLVASTLLCSEPVALYGNGPNSSIIAFTGTTGGISYTLAPQSGVTPPEALHIEALTIETRNTINSPAISATWSTYQPSASLSVHISNIHIRRAAAANTFTKGIALNKCINGFISRINILGDDSWNSLIGIDLIDCVGIRITDFDINRYRTGISVTRVSAVQTEGIFLSNGFIYDIGKGLYVKKAIHINLTNVFFNPNGTYATNSIEFDEVSQSAIGAGTLIYVGGNVSDPPNQRGISLLNCFGIKITSTEVTGVTKANTEYGVVVVTSSYNNISDCSFNELTTACFVSTGATNSVVDNFFFNCTSTITNSATTSYIRGNRVSDGTTLDAPRWSSNFGTFASGSLSANANFGCYLRGYSGSVADVALITSGGKRPINIINSTDAVFPETDNSYDVGVSGLRYRNIYGASLRPGDGTVIWTAGAGTPEGVVTAPVGSLFTRTDGGASTTLYVKQSGTGNTGWVAK